VEGPDALAARPVQAPARTQTARCQDALVVPLRNHGLARPAHTDRLLTVAAAGTHHALVMRNNTARGDQGQMSTAVDEPLRTLTTDGHQSLIRWDHLLVPYYPAPQRQGRRPDRLAARAADAPVPATRSGCVHTGGIMTVHPPADDMGQRARAAVESLLLNLVTRADPDAVVTEPVFPGAATTVCRPWALHGLAAALLVEHIAHGLAREHAARARGAGHTWLEIAAAAGLEPEAQRWERATAAFTFAAGEPSGFFANQTARWTCLTCRKPVTDHGPEAGIGDDETGHAEDCTRRRAQLAAWRRAGREASRAAAHDSCTTVEGDTDAN
jgi:hypothetical protein